MGLKLNSTTVPSSSVTLLGVKARPFRPTSTCSTRVPPTGRPFAGDALVGAPLAFSLYASKVFPVLGLRR